MKIIEDAVVDVGTVMTKDIASWDLVGAPLQRLLRVEPCDINIIVKWYEKCA